MGEERVVVTEEDVSAFARPVASGTPSQRTDLLQKKKKPDNPWKPKERSYRDIKSILFKFQPHDGRRAIVAHQIKANDHDSCQ